MCLGAFFARIASYIPESQNFPRMIFGRENIGKFILSLGEFYLPSWRRLILMEISGTDGGGVRSLSSLLIIKDLMRHCGLSEQAKDPSTMSSYHPIPYPNEGKSDIDHISSRFFPAHYFDYIGKNRFRLS